MTTTAVAIRRPNANSRAVILDELNKINRQHETLTPELVVDYARDEGSPMHSFIWHDGDEDAANEMRLMRARQLIGRFRIEIKQRGGQVINVKAFWRDPRAGRDEQGYVGAVLMRTQKDIAHDTIEREFKRLDGVIENLRSLAALAGVSAEVEARLKEYLL